MFASGACGLVWQMAWTAQFGFALGHEIVAVLSVVAAFFGGISAGSFLLAQKLESSLYPGRWYASLEALIAIWALLLAFFSPIFLPHLSQWIGAEPSAVWHWALAFFIPLIALLPATLAMGATLPAMERLLRRGDSQALGSVYAANTAGAFHVAMCIVCTGGQLQWAFHSIENGCSADFAGRSGKAVAAMQATL